MEADISDLVVRDVMRTRLVTLDPLTDVFDGITILVKNRISGAPVVDREGRLLGVFSEKCSMQVLLDAAYERLPTNKIQAFMDTNPLTVKPEANLLSIANVFLFTPKRRLPVIQDEILVGQISRRDVIAAAANQKRVKRPSARKLLYLSALRAMDEAPV